MAMCIPNPVYNSLDVRYTISFYNYKFCERDDVRHFVTLALGQVVTLTVEQIVCNFEVNRANCDTITKLGM